jgi:hypothetical protein
MPVFTNTSQQVFQDGDLIVLPGEKFATEDQGRIDQMRGLYKWQFGEGTGKAKSEAEVTEEGPAKPVRELRDIGYVALDDDGNQAALVGDASTSKK